MEEPWSVTVCESAPRRKTTEGGREATFEWTRAPNKGRHAKSSLFTPPVVYVRGRVGGVVVKRAGKVGGGGVDGGGVRRPKERGKKVKGRGDRRR